MASKADSRHSFSYNDQLKSYLNFSSIHSVVNEVVHFISALFRKYTNISLQEITIFQWIILFVCVWIVLHTVLFKLTEKFLRRVGVDEIKSKLLSKTVWDLCFFSTSSYMIVENLNLDVLKFASNTVKIIDRKTNECFLMDKDKIVRSEVLFVIITAYFIHSTSWTLLTKGFRNVEFLQKELITLFFILTRALRCTEYGMMVLLFLQSCQILEELTKLVCILGLICNSYVLRNISKCLFFVQIIYWCRQFMYQSPQLLLFLFSRKIDTTMVRAELNLILLAPATLTVYYLLSLYMSSANRLFWHLFRPAKISSSIYEYFLFGQLEDNTKSSGVRRHSSLKKKKKSEEEERKNQNKVALYQTVRCYMVLRRKLKRIREKRECEQETKMSNSVVSSDSDLSVKFGH